VASSIRPSSMASITVPLRCPYGDRDLTVIKSSDGTIWDRQAFEKAPTHLRMRLKTTAPIILVGSESPYPILAANQAWQDTCGYGKEAIGQTPKILQGERTNRKKAEYFSHDCVRNGHGRTVLVNYDSNREPFVHKLRMTTVGGFFLTESEILPPSSPIHHHLCKEQARDMTMELLAISLALILAYAAILLAPAAVISSSIPSSASVFKIASSLSITCSDAFVVAFMIFLSILVVAIHEAINEANDEGGRSHSSTSLEEHIDKAIALSLVLGATCLVVELSPHVPNGAIATCLCAILALAHSHEARCHRGAKERENSSSVPAGPVHGLFKTIFTTAAFLALLSPALSPPFGTQYIDK